jgi:phosphoribosyl 1,2-cyclic phosphodiesterase
LAFCGNAIYKSEVFSLTVLGSGSGGNCALVETTNTRVLIDAGFSARQICHRLESAGVQPDSLNAILLTHEHGDHTTGLEVFCRKHAVPIFCTRLTAEQLRRAHIGENASWQLFEAGSTFRIQDVEVESFYVPHDAVDPVAFVLRAGDGAVGFLTDLGHATKAARERIRNVNALVVETNHDEKLLQLDMKRPWSVKQRILSRHGHLSNRAAAQLVADIAGDALRTVILGHLSRECNNPDLALEAMHQLGLDSLELICAAQDAVSARLQIKASYPKTGSEPFESPQVQDQISPVNYHNGHQQYTESFFDLAWDWGQTTTGKA